jgi:hypothetical protein
MRTAVPILTWRSASAKTFAADWVAANRVSVLPSHVSPRVGVATFGIERAYRSSRAACGVRKLGRALKPGVLRRDRVYAPYGLLGFGAGRQVFHWKES